MSKISIRWSVDDGYIGNRPHTTELDTDDFDDDMTDEQLQEEIERAVQEDYDNNIRFSISDDSLSSAIAVIKRAKGKV